MVNYRSSHVPMDIPREYSRLSAHNASSESGTSTLRGSVRMRGDSRRTWSIIADTIVDVRIRALVATFARG